MRDTDYAKELARATAIKSVSEARIERLEKKEGNQVAIRFSWWKDGNMQPRPLDMTEEVFLTLWASALDNGTFSNDCLKDIVVLTSAYLENVEREHGM